MCSVGAARAAQGDPGLQQVKVRVVGGGARARGRATRAVPQPTPERGRALVRTPAATLARSCAPHAPQPATRPAGWGDATRALTRTPRAPCLPRRPAAAAAAAAPRMSEAPHTAGPSVPWDVLGAHRGWGGWRFRAWGRAIGAPRRRLAPPTPPFAHLAPTCQRAHTCCTPTAASQLRRPHPSRPSAGGDTPQRSPPPLPHPRTTPPLPSTRGSEARGAGTSSPNPPSWPAWM